jgi:CHAT domain-containing protein
MDETIPTTLMEAFTDIEGKEGALKILFLGDGRRNLPGVHKEFQAVIETLSPLTRQGYLHANFLLGRNLTKHKLESRIQETRYSIVYYAGHAYKNGRILPFADSDLDTLEYLKIINQNPPGLLIMNACNTLGDAQKLDLMTTLFVESGVVFAIGTSYKIKDDMPAKVFPQFFYSLICGRTPGEALMDAIRIDPYNTEQYFFLGDSSMQLR